MKKLKYVAHLQSGESITAEKFVEKGYPVYGGNGFRGYTDTYTHDGEYILIGRQGALCGNVNYAKNKFFATEHAIVVYPFHNESCLWLGEIIRLADLGKFSQSAAQPGIAVNIIKNIYIPVPPLPEQQQIADYLEQKSTETAQAIAVIERQLRLLQEYKTTLINASVTGKICLNPKEQS